MRYGRPIDKEESPKLYERHRWEVVDPNPPLKWAFVQCRQRRLWQGRVADAPIWKRRSGPWTNWENPNANDN